MLRWQKLHKKNQLKILKANVELLKLHLIKIELKLSQPIKILRFFGYFTFSTFGEIVKKFSQKYSKTKTQNVGTENKVKNSNF